MTPQDIRFICIKSIDNHYNNNRVNEGEFCIYKDETGVCDRKCDGLRGLPCDTRDPLLKQTNLRKKFNPNDDILRQQILIENPDYLELE